MHADTTCDLNALAGDLRSEQVTIRYLKDGREREVGAGRTPCGNYGTEVVLKPYIRVLSCRCQYCDPFGEDKETSTIEAEIPLADIVDVDAKDWDYGDLPDNPNPQILPLARWLLNKFGVLKRFALDC